MSVDRSSGSARQIWTGFRVIRGNSIDLAVGHLGLPRQCLNGRLLGENVAQTLLPENRHYAVIF